MSEGIFHFTIEVQQRLDIFLTEALKDKVSTSRSQIKKWIEAGSVLINQLPSTKAGLVLSVGDVVTVTIPVSTQTDIVAQSIPLDVLFEDESLLILNKQQYRVTPATARRVLPHPHGTQGRAMRSTYGCTK